MLLIREIGLYYKYLRAKVRYRGVVKFNGFTVLYSFPNSFISFQGKVTINSSSLSNMIGLSQRTIIVAKYGGQISIGEGTGISGSTIYSMKSIHIGKRCIIGSGCKIIDNDFHPLQASMRFPQNCKDIRKKAITIGDDCFIGTNSILLKGTVLGRNCVVGAGSVVSGSFPDNVIIAGNPAKIVRENLP